MPTSIRQRQSQSQTPGPAKGPDGRHIRLTSIKNARQNTPLRLETPSIARLPNERPKPQCPNKECPQSRVEETDGRLVCLNCGFLLQESQITQELTFGEASNGAAIVQGAFVGESDTTARNPAMAGNRIGGGMSSREQTERNGSHFMNSLVTALRLQTIDKDRGMKYFKLCASINFIQGRITRYVAAVCLYVACRGDPNCKVMLIDFADILEVNVFKLGQIYNEMVKELHLSGSGIRGNLYECNPENLIQRFAQDLEFGDQEHRIANEAVGILKRMKRDWIYTGRRPAGVCGAALILAARMNNYRRTVREVVYTAKVADVTINKRLDEFKFTDSSKLTVNEFRNFAHQIDQEHDPPAFYRQFEKKKKRKNSKRKIDEVEGAEEEDQSPTASARASAEPESNPNSPRPALTRQEQDAIAMPPPPIPIDPRLTSMTEPPSKKRRKTSHTPSDEEEDDDDDNEDDHMDLAEDDDELRSIISTTGRRRGVGRPKGAKNKPLPVKTAAAIADEEQMEREMLAALEDPENLAEAERYHQSMLPTPPQTQKDGPAQAPATPVATEEAPQPTPVPGDHIDVMSTTIYSFEFDDDPEVRDCLLSAADVAIKEAVWVTNNGTWLKDQQARAIKRELQEKSGTVKVPLKRRRHRKRLGDMSEYETQNEDGTVSRPTTAAEATRMMLEKRGYSKKINYDAIVSRAYDRSPSEASGTPPSEPASFLGGGLGTKRSRDAEDTAPSAKRIRKGDDEEVPTPSKTKKAMRAPRQSAARGTASSPVATGANVTRSGDIIDGSTLAGQAGETGESGEQDGSDKEAEAAAPDEDEDEDEEEEEEEVDDDWRKLRDGDAEEDEEEDFSDYGEEV